MKKIVLLPLFSIAIVISTFAQTKLTIQSPNEKCATVETSPRDGTFGDRGLWAARLNQGGGSFTVIRSFLQFDLSSIPKGSFVNWARLSLFNAGLSFGSNACLLRRVTSKWDPTTITWNTQPSEASRGTIRLPVRKDGENQKNINVTNLVQNIVDSPTSSFGFAVRLDTDAIGNSSRSVLFYSPAYDKSHYNPKLVMEYTAPGMQRNVTTMSVDLSGLPTQMSLYPNPCNSAFNCSIKSADRENLALRVIDIIGRTIYMRTINAQEPQIRINLPLGSIGTYYVFLQNSDGETIVCQELLSRQ